MEELEGRLGELLSEKARLEDRTTILEHTLEMRRATSGEIDELLARRLGSVVRDCQQYWVQKPLCHQLSHFSNNLSSVVSQSACRTAL